MAKKIAEKAVAEKKVGAPKAKVENSPKPKLAAQKKGKDSAEKPKKDTEKPKKAPEKSKKDSPVETMPSASNVGIDRLPQAKIFPATLEHKELGKLKACTGKYLKYADIRKALEEDKTLYFATFWTKRHLKEYEYAKTHAVKTPKDGFPNDLDMLMAVLPCETIDRVYAMSSYTEALFRFEGEDFTYIEDTDPRSGDKFKIRVSAGMEFEIYEPAE